MYHFFNLRDYLNLFITKLCFLFLISNFITLYLILLSQTLTLFFIFLMDYRIGFFSLICFFSFIFKKINVWFFFSQNKIFMISDIIQAFSRSFVFFSLRWYEVIFLSNVWFNNPRDYPNVFIFVVEFFSDQLSVCDDVVCFSLQTEVGCKCLNCVQLLNVWQTSVSEARLPAGECVSHLNTSTVFTDHQTY